MDHESANYLTSDTSFNVILNAEALESFASPGEISDMKASEILEDINLNNIQDSNDEDTKEQLNQSEESKPISEVKPLLVPSLKVILSISLHWKIEEIRNELGNSLFSTNATTVRSSLQRNFTGNNMRDRTPGRNRISVWFAADLLLKNPM